MKKSMRRVHISAIVSGMSSLAHALKAAGFVTKLCSRSDKLFLALYSSDLDLILSYSHRGAGQIKTHPHPHTAFFHQSGKVICDIRLASGVRV